MKAQGRFSFPRIENIILRNFSLFTKDGKIYEVNEKIKGGVYCLAGANGLGKTSLLTAVNYGLTGIVLEPKNKIAVPKEIFKKNKRYTARYFEGRIKAQDKGEAEIEIDFSINNKHYKIVRGFFDLQELRNLEIYEEKNKKKIPLISTSDLSPKELNKKYEEELTKDIGLKYFEDFIFLQLFLFTFDESRRIIFWDALGSQIVLSMAFHTEQDGAERLTELRTSMEKRESNGRNKRWQANQVMKKIKDLESKKPGSENPEEIAEQYREICENYDETKKIYQNTKIEYDELLKSHSKLAYEKVILRNKLTDLFSRYSKPRSKLLNNTEVKKSIEDKECFLCGAGGEQVQSKIESNINTDKCPLCGTGIMDDVRSREQDELHNEIEKIDKQIGSKKEALENIVIGLNEKEKTLKKIKFEFEEIEEEKKKFEGMYDYILPDTNRSGGVAFLVEQYREQYKELDKEAKEEYKKRDELKPEYKQLQQKLKTAYKSAEIQFLPIFQRLAKSFIGLDLSIKIEKKTNLLSLSLILQDTVRTEFHQLSESQRFFLDIALRMSLTIYMSQQGQEGAMYIDTPEGSLDIAYESRAGKMFADFVKSNHRIFMTANINASQLLIALAKECGASRMQLRRMLEWIDLSEVQKDGEELFDRAYQNIEEAMKENNYEK